MIPEAQGIEKEFTLRLIPLSQSTKLTKESLLRWLLLSLGLISRNESRTGALEIIAEIASAEGLEVSEIVARLKGRINEKNVYYHIKRMEEAGLIEKKGKKYFLSIEKAAQQIRANSEKIASLLAEASSTLVKL
ncbi:MAG: helix-turn-helix domain-containing protein [Candidatus Anstonellales archaeon]